MTKKTKTNLAGLNLPILTPLLLLISLLVVKIIDNDLWWLLAMGENIMENGIPVIEPLTLHEGLDFVAQQWLTSVIFRWVYDTLGYAGLMVFITAVDAFIIYLMNKVCTLFGGSTRIGGIISAALSMFLIFPFGVSRPQIFTFCIVIIEIICLEKYARDNNWKYLIPLPVLSVLEINLHGSMWPMLFVLGAPYGLEYIIKWAPWKISCKKKKARTGTAPADPRTYKILPLIAACITMAVCGLINPYGIKSMTYLFTSYGSDLINGIVTEMKPFTLQSNATAFIILMLIIVFVCKSKKKLPLRYTILAAGTIYLALSSAKGCAYALIAGAPILAYGYSDIKVPDSLLKKPMIPVKFRKFMASFFCIAVLIIVGIKQTYIGLSGDITEQECLSAAEAIEYVENNTDITHDSIIYADYNTGGYFEFCGYKPYIDARAEIFMKVNNGKKDILEEFNTAGHDPYACDDLIAEYGFDYIFAAENNAIHQYLKNTEESGYELIFTADDPDDVYGLFVWKKIENKEGTEG